MFKKEKSTRTNYPLRLFLILGMLGIAQGVMPKQSDKYSDDRIFRFFDFITEPRPTPEIPVNYFMRGHFVNGPVAIDTDVSTIVEQLNHPVFEIDKADKIEALYNIAQKFSINHEILISLLVQLANEGLIETSLNANDFSAVLSQMCSWLNDGFYGKLYRDEHGFPQNFSDVTPDNGQFIQNPQIENISPAEYSIGRFIYMILGQSGRSDNQMSETERILALTKTFYHQHFGLFNIGDPRQPHTKETVDMKFPWKTGTDWVLSGGPHGAWGVSSAWSAVDFAPNGSSGCTPVETAPVVPLAPGVVTYVDTGLVITAHEPYDKDGTKWDGRVGHASGILHLANIPVKVGDVVDSSTTLGIPSCIGGVADGSHIHVYNMVNGEFIPATDSQNIQMSGYTFGQDYPIEYDGFITNGETTYHAFTSEKVTRHDALAKTGVLISDNTTTLSAPPSEFEVMSKDGTQARTVDSCFDSLNNPRELGSIDTSGDRLVQAIEITNSQKEFEGTALYLCGFDEGSSGKLTVVTSVSDGTPTFRFVVFNQLPTATNYTTLIQSQ